MSKRCEPCRAANMIHCADPANCGGPWDARHDDPLVNWVVFDHPRDQPDFFVARAFHYDLPTVVMLLGRTLEDVRSLIPPGLTRMPRSPGDHPNVVETWF